MIIVVMGVAGCGKSTIGRRLASHLAVSFADADDYHPPANVGKMRQGIPLTDTDRMPWYAALNAMLRDHAGRGEGVVLACSALTARYREWLATGLPELRFVFLNGSRALLAERMAARRDHFMPASLLDSQLATLEPPFRAIEIDIAATPDDIVRTVIAQLGRTGR